MSIRMECKHCFRPLKAKDSAAGKKIQCPGCDTILKVPRPRRRKNEEDEFADALNSIDSHKDYAPISDELPPARRSRGKSSSKKSRDYGAPVSSQLASLVIGGFMLFELVIYVIRRNLGA
ncbi:hypothetical protein [Rubinisphaera italica]|uniref:Uncharacterized protein n=1 Tax=Rubinisphaera italica TaxID=2527969 RepID=A0A5C5XBM3_9PLAN|nr:hypothetical protein [Rubinisphaera italica]TWT59322.1 hypothetical protein Pan54_00220 [Rubinisphaera italica]